LTQYRLLAQIAWDERLLDSFYHDVGYGECPPPEMTSLKMILKVWNGLTVSKAGRPGPLAVLKEPSKA